VKRLLKLTGGSFSGRKLYVPALGVRPATNLVREAVFSTLGPFFKDGVLGLKVLDLFAGSGSLGLEAISRGAQAVTFVDCSRDSVKSIQKNLQIMGFAGSVVRADVIVFLRQRREVTYDLIFMDPPYRYEKCPEVVGLLKTSLQPVNPTILVHERAYREELPPFGADLKFLKRKRYGQTEILYYEFSS
jgi:16S rRNA (guanine966-N2)-methyltransferase